MTFWTRWSKILFPKRSAKGVLTWHRGDFRAGASSSGIPLMALYLFTWYDHKMSGQRETLRYEISQRYRVKAKRPPVSAWNRSAGRLERVAYALCFRFWITRVCYQHEVYLQITRYEMTQSTYKSDTKSKSHPGTSFLMWTPSKMIDSGEKSKQWRKLQLAFELQNSLVYEKRSNSPCSQWMMSLSLTEIILYLI